MLIYFSHLLFSRQFVAPPIFTSPVLCQQVVLHFIIRVVGFVNIMLLWSIAFLFILLVIAMTKMTKYLQNSKSIATTFSSNRHSSVLVVHIFWINLEHNNNKVLDCCWPITSPRQWLSQFFSIFQGFVIIHQHSCFSCLSFILP